MISKTISRAKQRLAEEESQLLEGAENEDLVKYWSAYLDGARAQLSEDTKQEQQRIAEEIRGYKPTAYRDF